MIPNSPFLTNLGTSKLQTYSSLQLRHSEWMGVHMYGGMYAFMHTCMDLHNVGLIACMQVCEYKVLSYIKIRVVRNAYEG